MDGILGLMEDLCWVQVPRTGTGRMYSQETDILGQCSDDFPLMCPNLSVLLEML